MYPIVLTQEDSVTGTLFSIIVPEQAATKLRTYGFSVAQPKGLPDTVFYKPLAILHLEGVQIGVHRQANGKLCFEATILADLTRWTNPRGGYYTVSDAVWSTRGSDVLVVARKAMSQVAIMVKATCDEWLNTEKKQRRLLS